jgi:hypothetical protein
LYNSRRFTPSTIRVDKILAKGTMPELSQSIACLGPQGSFSHDISEFALARIPFEVFEFERGFFGANALFLAV